jgi:hypothetical protein
MSWSRTTPGPLNVKNLLGGCHFWAR